jgi:hypothetical protein
MYKCRVADRAGEITPGRYSIKYHDDTKRFGFYLSGATKNNRQKIYESIVRIMIEGKKLNLVNYNDNANQNVWNNINFPQLKLSIEPTEIGDIEYYRVIGKIDPEYIQAITFENTDQFLTNHINVIGGTLGLDIDLGLIPTFKDPNGTEEMFANGIWEYYSNLPKSISAEVLKLENLKFRTWDGLTTLFGVSLKTEIENLSEETTLEKETAESVEIQTIQKKTSKRTRKTPAPVIVNRPVYDFRIPTVDKYNNPEAVYRAILGKMLSVTMVEIFNTVE